MCDVTLKDRKSNVELRNMLGIESISEVMCGGRLRWFGHVERIWVGSCVTASSVPVRWPLRQFQIGRCSWRSRQWIHGKAGCWQWTRHAHTFQDVFV